MNSGPTFTAISAGGNAPYEPDAQTYRRNELCELSRGCSAILAKRSPTAGRRGKLNYTQLFKVKPGTRVKLKDIDPAFKGDHKNDEDAAEELAQLQKRLRELQGLLYTQPACPVDLLAGRGRWREGWHD